MPNDQLIEMLSEMFVDLSEAAINAIIKELLVRLSEALDLKYDENTGLICSITDPNDCIRVQDWARVAFSEHATELILLSKVWNYRNMQIQQVSNSAERKYLQVGVPQSKSYSCWVAVGISIYNARKGNRYKDEDDYFDKELPEPDEISKFLSAYMNDPDVADAVQLAKLYEGESRSIDRNLRLFSLLYKKIIQTIGNKKEEIVVYNLISQYCDEKLKDKRKSVSYYNTLIKAAIDYQNDSGCNPEDWYQKCLGFRKVEYASDDMEYESIGVRLRDLLKKHKYLAITIPQGFQSEYDPDTSGIKIYEFNQPTISDYPIEYVISNLPRDKFETGHQIALVGLSGNGLNTKVRLIDPGKDSLSVQEGSYYSYIEWEKAAAFTYELWQKDRNGAQIQGYDLYYL